MNTALAFMMGEKNRGKESMVFDWDKAAKLIKSSGASQAEAGLAGDWEWTGGVIFENGKPETKSYTYLSSTWATPEIEIDGIRQQFYRMKSETPDWDSSTKWPESALKILEESAIPGAAGNSAQQPISEY